MKILQGIYRSLWFFLGIQLFFVGSFIFVIESIYPQMNENYLKETKLTHAANRLIHAVLDLRDINGQRLTESLQAVESEFKQDKEVVEILGRINLLLSRWSTSQDRFVYEDLVSEVEKILYLSETRMTKTLEEIKSRGVTSGWTVGIMGLLLMGWQLLLIQDFRKRCQAPLEEIFFGIRDWARGSRMRRLKVNSDDPAVTSTIEVINHLLDNHTLR